MTDTEIMECAVVTTFGWNVSSDRPYHIAELRAGGLYGTSEAGPDSTSRRGSLARDCAGNVRSFATSERAREYASDSGYEIAGDGIMLPDARADHYWTVQMVEEPQQATREEIREYHKSSHVVDIIGDDVWLTENSGNWRRTYVGQVSDYYWTFFAGDWRLWQLEAARENNRDLAIRRLVEKRAER